jgi:hypothetical protein
MVVGSFVAAKRIIKMKHLVKHLVENNLNEIVSKSILNCHCEGLHSIMLLDSKGKTIRLYISLPKNKLYRNFPKNFNKTKMSIAFHPHHCNLTIHCIMGKIFNWNVKESRTGLSVNKYKYSSQITEGRLAFEKISSTFVETINQLWIKEGQSLNLNAKTIHTIACESDKLNAWLVYEGNEDNHYDSFCLSNDEGLNLKKATKLYKKPTSDEVIYLLKLVHLIQ